MAGFSLSTCPLAQRRLSRHQPLNMRAEQRATLVAVTLALLALAQAAKQDASTAAVVLRSGLGWQDCECGTVLRPLHTEQVADIVMALHRDTQVTGQKYLVRATSNGFLSHNNFSCPCSSAPAGVRAVALDMSGMDKVLQFSADQETVTVQAGITFEALERILFDYDMSLPGVVIAPALASMTVGSAVVTAAHGSSLVGPAGIAAFLQSALLVDGTGEIHALDEPGDVLEGSLGMLGVVTEVTLYVQPKKKVAVRQLQSEDFDMVTDLRDIIDNSEALALDVTWSPTAGMYTARVWHDTEEGSRGDARNVVLQQPSEWLDKLGDRVHRDQLDVHDREGFMCEVIGEMSHFPYFLHTPGNEPDDGAPHNTAIGYINHMASASCAGVAAQAAGASQGRRAAAEASKGGLLQGLGLGLGLGGQGSSRAEVKSEHLPSHGCLLGAAKWTPYELAINSQDFSSWLADARAIFSHAMGCPPFVFNFRFVGESDAPLALSSGRQVVAIELSTLSTPHAKGGRGLPLKLVRLHEEVLQMTLCKYHGRPHWAFGTNRLFRGPCPVRDMYGDAFDKFLEQRKTYDAAGMFTPPLFEDVAARRGPEYYPGCAANLDCFCTADEHCGAGHVCVPGYVFPEYKVCAPVKDNSKHEL